MKTTIRTTILPLVLGFLTLETCCLAASDPPAPTRAPAAGEKDPAQPPATTNLAGMTFVSVEKREVGLGPKGPAMGYWQLSFSGQTVSWRHSDVSEAMSYAMAADGTIEAKRTSGRGNPIKAKYDAAKKEIVWENLTYKAK